MRGIYKKKGAAHFEMIVSFAFFISFIFFMFIILRPYNSTTLTGAVVNGMYDSFEDEVNTNLSDIFIEAGYPGGQDCFYVTMPNDAFAYGLTNSVARDVDDGLFSSELDSGGSTSDLSINDPADSGYYKVAVSPIFEDESLGPCDQVDPYVIGSVLEREVVSYSSLVDMGFRYNSSASSYEELKSDLNVPSVFDFAIVSADMPEISMTRTIPDSGEVVAEEYVLEVLYVNGTVVNSRFTLIVW